MQKLIDLTGSKEESINSSLGKKSQKADDVTKLRAKVQNQCIEMIWFGGINDEIYDSVFHVTLTLDFVTKNHFLTSTTGVKSGQLFIQKLRNNEGKLAKLKRPDRFFYNQEFYLQEPTDRLVEMGLGYTGRYTSQFFDKNRFIGVVGREAFHVFDLAQMDFIYADESSGYKVNIEKNLVNEDSE